MTLSRRNPERTERKERTSMAKNGGEHTELEAKKKELDQVIEKYKDDQGALIPVLHEAQKIFGYLPFEVQLQVSEGLGIPLAEVYGVVTFYTGFSIKPKGRYQINVCLGTACYVKGAEAVLDKFRTVLSLNAGDCTEDRRFSLDACRCIGACGLAPAVMINDDVYGNVTPEDVEDILKNYEDTEDRKEGGK